MPILNFCNICHERLQQKNSCNYKKQIFFPFFKISKFLLIMRYWAPEFLHLSSALLNITVKQCFLYSLSLKLFDHPTPPPHLSSWYLWSISCRMTSLSPVWGKSSTSITRNSQSSMATTVNSLPVFLLMLMPCNTTTQAPTSQLRHNYIYGTSRNQKVAAQWLKNSEWTLLSHNTDMFVDKLK